MLPRLAPCHTNYRSLSFRAVAPPEGGGVPSRIRARRELHQREAVHLKGHVEFAPAQYLPENEHSLTAGTARSYSRRGSRGALAHKRESPSIGGDSPSPAVDDGHGAPLVHPAGRLKPYRDATYSAVKRPKVLAVVRLSPPIDVEYCQPNRPPDALPAANSPGIGR